MATKVERLLEKAARLARKGKSERALALVREACERAPHDPDPWRERGALAGQMGLREEAAEALFRLADMYARSGMKAEAAGAAAEVLAIEPGHGGARRFARLFGGEGDESETESPPPRPSPEGGGGQSVAGRLGEGETESETESPPPRPSPEGGGGQSVGGRLGQDGGDGGGTVVVIEAEPGRGGGEVARRGEQSIGRVTGTLAIVDISLTDGVDGAEFSLDDEDGSVVQAVAATVGSSPLLSELDSDLVRYLIDLGTLIHCAAGKAVFVEGEQGSSLYLVLRGAVDVERADLATGTIRRLASLRPGAFFGEMALLTDAPRSATVRAAAAATLLEVPREAVRKLVARNRRLLKLLMRFFRARLVGTLVATSPLFAPLSLEERRDLVTRFRLRELPPDHVVVAKGVSADGLYLVLVGELAAVVDGGAPGERILGYLGPGDVFGEMSLLDEHPAMASIRTESRAWVLRLPRDDFEAIAAVHPSMRRQLTDIAETRRERNRATLGDPLRPI